MRVLLADDHQMVRQGLRLLLEEEPDVQVVAEVSDGRAAVAAARDHGVDVVVMDLSMPGLNGVEATRVIVGGSPSVRVVCLSMHADRAMVSAALEAGASGYVLKNRAGAELVEALRTVASQGTYLSPAVAPGVVADYLSHLAPEGGDDEQLTAREREVLQLIAEGGSTKDIAVRLDISAKTVATHREHIMAKLDLRSVAGLTRYAIRRGITTSERLDPG